MELSSPSLLDETKTAMANYLDITLGVSREIVSVEEIDATAAVCEEELQRRAFAVIQMHFEAIAQKLSLFGGGAFIDRDLTVHKE